MQIQHRRIGRAFGLHKGIGKARQQLVLRRRIGPNRQARALVHHDLAQIVDAMHMIGVRMGVDHSVKRADVGVQQLVVHVGGGVDQHAGDCRALDPLDQQRTAAAAVFRIGGVAIAPMPAQTRHAAR